MLISFSFARGFILIALVRLLRLAFVTRGAEGNVIFEERSFFTAADTLGHLYLCFTASARLGAIGICPKRRGF
jgi:hypothetical protein